MEVAAPIGSSADLGLAIRERRRALRLDQAALAKRVGVSRQWISDIERGKPRAELALVLRTLKELDLEIVVQPMAHHPEVALVERVLTRAGQRR